MKKLLIIIGIILCASQVCASGGVQSDNLGNKGYIFVATGENHGNNSRGIWTDPSFLKGETGSQGITGLNGSDGIDGKDGYTPIKGIDYNDGEKGLQGLQGVAGQVGEQGLQGLTGQQGETGTEGKDGQKGDVGAKGIQGLQGKELEDRYELMGELRLLDTKRTTWSVYAGHDVNNDVGIYGAKVTIKFGRSYYEKKIDEIEAKLNMLPTPSTEEVTVVPTKTGFRIQVDN